MVDSLRNTVIGVPKTQTRTRARVSTFFDIGADEDNHGEVKNTGACLPDEGIPELQKGDDEDTDDFIAPNPPADASPYSSSRAPYHLCDLENTDEPLFTSICPTVSRATASSFATCTSRDLVKVHRPHALQSVSAPMVPPIDLSSIKPPAQPLLSPRGTPLTNPKKSRKMHNRIQPWCYDVLNNKRSVIKIRNPNDKLCMHRDVVVSLAYQEW